MKQAANPLLVQNSSISINLINTFGWGLPINRCLHNFELLLLILFE